MKKIGFIIPWYGENIPGGAEAALRGITSHLITSGIDVEVLTTCVEKFLSDWNCNYYPEGTDIVAGVPVRRFPVCESDADVFHRVNHKLMQNKEISLDEEDTFLKEMINCPTLYEYLDKNKDEYALYVFIPYMFNTSYYGAQICPEKSILIPCLHDESYAHLKRYKEVYSKLRGMIFLAKPEYDLANKLYELSSTDTSTIGSGLDTEISGEPERFRNKYSIVGDFILYAGRKDVGKNVDTLLGYFYMYSTRNPGKLKLVLIGGDELHIPEQARENVIDLSFIPIQDKYDAYSAALCLCQPSLNESFSIVIMESWLCGRPILVHERCPVTKSFAQESKGGLYFSDYHEFEGCLDYYLSNKEKASYMGILGREFVIKNFSWDVITGKYIDFFRQVSK